MMVGQQIERRVDVGFVVEGRGCRADALQPVAALPVVGQQAVDVAAGDPAVVAHRAVVLGRCRGCSSGRDVPVVRPICIS